VRRRAGVSDPGIVKRLSPLLPVQQRFEVLIEVRFKVSFQFGEELSSVWVVRSGVGTFPGMQHSPLSWALPEGQQQAARGICQAGTGVSGSLL
jgi:hypothetical protein